jgi:hypothetical protein
MRNRVTKEAQKQALARSLHIELISQSWMTDCDRRTD